MDTTEPKPVNKFYFIGTPEEHSFLPALRNVAGGVAMGGMFTRSIITATECVRKAKEANAECIVTTHQQLLEKIRPEGITTGTVSTFAGSVLYHHGFPILIIDPLKQSRTVAYWSFVTKRYLQKFTKPASFLYNSPFNFKLCQFVDQQQDAEQDLSNAKYIVFDIETDVDPVRRITCIGFTGIFPDGKLRTYTFPFTDMVAYAIAKRILENPVEKVAQNGKYDCEWLMMFGICVENFLWDTLYLSHCLYSELPKDLGFITTLWVRDSYNWKELGKSADLETHYLYNGKDTWGTALTFLNILHNYPDYAIKNYSMEFPLLFPTLMCDMTGIKRDMERLRESQKKLEEEIKQDTELLHRMLGFPLNVNSPQQKLKLLHALGFVQYKSADEKHMLRAAYGHPFYAHILNKILSLVKKNKLLSTYLTEGKEYHGRILYNLSPPGTDTGRLACTESSFWCGLQLQNIPRGKAVKSTLSADDGFLFNECDLEQAESRDTAYASGCETLIAAVSGERDFHSVNCSAFFGVPYSDIYDQDKRKTKLKDLRDLAKRVNHGANYVMGADVLVQTMGLEKIATARRLLQLPTHWTPIEIAEYLLMRFHSTYPELEKIYYPSIVNSVVKTKKLTGAMGWTRYCFKDPLKDKRAKNAYVAHKAQSENAMKLNASFMRVFYEIMLNPLLNRDIIIFGQIHDSIPHQVRIGKEYLTNEVKSRMELPLTVTGADGKTRTYTVPAACKTPSKYWSDCE